MNARATAKLGLVFLLTLVILLALLAVGVTISSREAYRQQAVDSIAQSYAGSQTFTGPVVAESYKQEIASSQIDSKGVTTVKRSSIDGTQIIDPKTLVVRGVLVPSLRHHGFTA
jgi:inner membrane protein